jgi:hypothetical protein
VFFSCAAQQSKRPENSIIIQNQFMRFMADGSDASLMIRCALIVRVQKSQDLLESLFKLVLCSRKGVGSLCSRKAIYKRAPESLSNIINLAQLAIQDNDQEVAKKFWVLF